MEIRKWIKQFPSSEELARVYQLWRRKYPPIKNFSVPQRLIEFLYIREPSKFKTQDKILYSFIAEYQSAKDPTILAVYLFILLYPFMRLAFLTWRKFILRLQIQENEIWNEVWVAYCKTLNEYDLKKRHEKIGLYFQGKVKNELKSYFRRTDRQRRYEVPLEEGIEKSGRCMAMKKKEVFTQDEIDEMEKILNQLVKEKKIGATDKYIIVESRLKKTSITKIAKSLRLPYFTVAKRRYRAEARIVEVLKKIINGLSNS